MTAPETPQEELQKKAEAKEKEILCVNLIVFTRELVYKSKEGKGLVAKLNLVQRIFEDYLFASHYTSLRSGNQDDEEAANNLSEKVIQMTGGSRAGDKKKSVFTGNLSKQEAFNLLIRFMGDDKEVLEKFIRENLHELVEKHMPVPQKWGQQAFTKSNRYQKFVGLKQLGGTCYMNSIM